MNKSEKILCLQIRRKKEVMEGLLEKLLASETETEVLEFKEAKNSFSKDKLGQYFSALGNEANLMGKENAYLLFGVNNNGKIVGTFISEHTINDYKREIADHTSPSLSFSAVHRLNTENGTVIICEIPPAPVGVPIAWKGHRYGRNGESLGGLNDNEVGQIMAQGKHQDWSAQIIEDAGLEDLSADAIAVARKQFTEKNPKLRDSIAEWDTTTFLNKAKVCINGKISRTAILLLGKAESEHFINPSTAKISWILKDRDNLEKDYEHFTCPLLLAVENVQGKIRNLRYRYIKDGSLFPEQVEQYDPYIIREALNNCIAHQDYTLGGKINIVEREDGVLTFVNSGSFIPKSVEQVVQADAPETKYRNPFLANAMVNLNMIDTIGSGIKKMFIIQRNKYFPLPDYDLTHKKVKVQIIGKVLDMNYARKLASSQNLKLDDIILLDKVAKRKVLTKNEADELKRQGLIEGRKPNYYISSTLAKTTGEKAKYIKQRGFKDEHYKKMILEFIKQYGSATKKDIDQLILDILPSVLDEKKKANKVRNIVYAMSKKDETIVNKGTNRNPKWVLSSSKLERKEKL